MITDNARTEQADGDTGPTRVPLLADTPLRDPALDGFGFVVFANALCLVVDHERTATPLTIAVSAPWGGGKSSIGGMLQTLLERRVARRDGDHPRLVCWFNAWEHEDAEHLGAALAGAVAREASRHRPWWRRALFPLPSAMLESGERLRRTLATAAVCLLVAAAVAVLQSRLPLIGKLFREDSVDAVRGAGAVGVAILALLVFQRVFATAKSAARFIDDPRSAAARGSMAEVKHQLGTLIRHATRDGRLVILIDDLDRCESERALEVCRVASQLLAHHGVVSVLLADMSRIAESAGIRFAGGNGSNSTGQADDAGRRYLEKIAQIELTLPAPDPTAMRKVTLGFSASLRAQRASPDISEPGDLDRFADRAAAARRRLAATFGWTRRSLGGWVEAAKWWPVLAWIPLTVALMGLVPADAEGYVPGWVIAVVSVALLGALGIGIWSSVLRRRRRRRRKDYERRIEELKGRGELSPEAVEDVVIADAISSAPGGDRALVGDLVSSSFLDSPEFRAVERFIVDHPPPLPREGKRMFNHAQLLTEIARARAMFGGDPPLEPAHLAKWVVLRERWHAIGRAVLLEPDLMNRLEAAAVGDGSERLFESLGLRVQDQELTQLLRTPPRLGGLIERLIYFMPSRGITEPARSTENGSREPA